MSKDMRIGGEVWTGNGISVNPGALRDVRMNPVVSAEPVGSAIRSRLTTIEGSQQLGASSRLSGEIVLGCPARNAASRRNGIGRWGSW